MVSVELEEACSPTIFSRSQRKLMKGVVHSVASSMRVYMWTSRYQTVTNTERKAAMWCVSISMPPICDVVTTSVCAFLPRNQGFGGY